jgi:hypothetical protein
MYKMFANNTDELSVKNCPHNSTSAGAQPCTPTVATNMPGMSQHLQIAPAFSGIMQQPRLKTHGSIH